jgi:hypothetical protein
MTERLPCGHPIGWILRLRDGPTLKKYCWGCAIDKLGLKEIGRAVPVAPVIEVPAKKATKK